MVEPCLSHLSDTCAEAYLVQLQAQLLLDHLSPCEDGNVLQVAALALAKAGRLHCNDLQTKEKRV